MGFYPRFACAALALVVGTTAFAGRINFGDSGFGTPAQSQVEIRFQESRPGKPPLIRMYFDITLRNFRSAPRWFLLPNSLGSSLTSIGTSGGVDAVEVYLAKGQGSAVIGHFLGNGGFQALLLPGRGKVRLRFFEVLYWGEMPTVLDIKVVIAKRITVGGESIRKWFGDDPTSSAESDIDGDTESPERALTSRHTPDNKEVAVVIEDAKRVTVKVPIRSSTK